MSRATALALLIAPVGIASLVSCGPGGDNYSAYSNLPITCIENPKGGHGLIKDFSCTLQAPPGQTFPAGRAAASIETASYGKALVDNDGFVMDGQETIRISVMTNSPDEAILTVALWEEGSGVQVLKAAGLAYRGGPFEAPEKYSDWDFPPIETLFSDVTDGFWKIESENDIIGEWVDTRGEYANLIISAPNSTTLTETRAATPLEFEYGTKDACNTTSGEGLIVGSNLIMRPGLTTLAGCIGEEWPKMPVFEKAKIVIDGAERLHVATEYGDRVVFERLPGLSSSATPNGGQP